MSAHICIPICIVRGRDGGWQELIVPRVQTLRNSKAVGQFTYLRLDRGSNCGTILFFGSVNQDVDIINVAGINWSPSPRPPSHDHFFSPRLLLLSYRHVGEGVVAAAANEIC